MLAKANDIENAFNKTLGEIARLVDGEVVGDDSLVITGLCGIREAKKGDLTFVENPKYFPLARKTKASAIITSRDISQLEKPIIRTDNPSLAFAKVVSLIYDDSALNFKGIHPTALIAQDARIGKDVYIGPYVVIESQAKVGDNTVIHSGTYVGRQTIIGQQCLIYPNITIRERITIGNRVVIHCGAVIGSDGFGFTNVQGAHEKVPQIGTVVIEDDVEIGANVTIDRARFDKTFIGRGTKIDNLVQVGHNVIIGENCIIVAQVGISGSVTIGKGVILAGQAGIVGHLTIGEGVVVASQSAVTKSVPPFTKVWGCPAKPHDIAKRVNASLQRLPHYVKTIQELKERIESLEARLNGLSQMKRPHKSSTASYRHSPQ